MRTFQQTLARDLVLSNGRLVLIDSVKAVATKLRNRLLLFSGEWFLDTRLGVPWFVFFEKNPDLDSLRRLVLSVITETSELITEVPQLDLDLDRATRTLRVTFQVVCDGSLIEGDTAGEFFVDGAPVYVDPVPVLTSVTSVSQVGGTVTATGSAFLPGAVLWTDGVARATTYVNATTLTAVVPAHAVGSVNAYVVQSSGTSNTVSFAYTSSIIDPATLNLAGYWQQGRGADFNPAGLAASKWPGVPSAGSSGSRPQGEPNTGGGWTTPTLATAIGGVSPVLYDTVLDELITNQLVSAFATSGAFCWAVLLRISSASASVNTRLFDGVYTHVRGGNSGTTGQLTFNVSTVSNNYEATVSGLPLDTWFAAFGQFDGANVKLRINESAPASTSAAIALPVTSPLRGCNEANGSIVRQELARIYTPTLTDQNCADIYAYWKATFPAAGLP